MMSGQDKDIINEEKLKKINGGTPSDIFGHKDNNTRSLGRDDDDHGRGVKEIPGDLNSRS